MSALALAEDWRSEVSRTAWEEAKPTRPTIQSPPTDYRLTTNVMAGSGPRPEGILSVLIRECLQNDADPDEEAEKLLNRFGSLGGVLFASLHDLRGVIRKSEELHHLFVAVRNASTEILKDTIDLRPIITTSEAFLDFARAKIGHETRVVCCVVYLDSNMRVLEVQEHGRGTTNTFEWYPREICTKALMDFCCNVVVFVNTLKDHVVLSQHDVVPISNLYVMLRLIDVVLHDCIIISKNSAVSFRSLGLLEE